MLGTALKVGDDDFSLADLLQSERSSSGVIPLLVRRRSLASLGELLALPQVGREWLSSGRIASFVAELRESGRDALFRFARTSEFRFWLEIDRSIRGDQRL